MARILLRNVPESVYQRLKQAAAQSHRSIAAEALARLEQSLEDDIVHLGRLQALRDLDRLWEEEGRQFADSAPLIREDRG